MDKKKKILAAIIAATMLTSSVSSMAFAVADTNPASAYTNGNVALMDDENSTVYYTDDFSSYTSTGISVQGTAGQTATLGNLDLALGARGSGGDTTSVISIGQDGDNNYLKFVSGKYASSERGASFTFNSACNIPAYASIEDGKVLQMSFKAYFKDAAATMQIFGLTSDDKTGNGDVVNDPYLSVGNNAQIPTAQWVDVNIEVDNTGAANMVMTDTDGNLLSAKSFKASGTALGKVAFYGAASEVYMDNLAVKQTAKTTSALTLNIKDDKNADLTGTTVTVDKCKQVVTGSQLVLNVPNKTYSITATKDAYKDAADTVEVTADTEKTITLSANVYTPIPTKITVAGGQKAMTAPINNDSVASTAFTATSVDQENIAITDATYKWSIVGADGQTDENVSISDAGVITVKKGFKAAENHVEEFTVTATATNANGSGTGTATVKISDYLFYEPGVDEASYGGEVSTVFDGTKAIVIPITKTTKTMTMPEEIKFEKGTAKSLSFNLSFTEKGYYTFARTFALKDSSGNNLLGDIYVGGPAATTGMSIGTGATVGDAMNWDSGKCWGLFDANVWVPVTIDFITYSNGTTKATVKVGDNDAVEVDVADGVTGLAKIDFTAGAAMNGRYVGFKDFVVQDADASATDISGIEDIAKISGQDTEAEYTVTSTLMEEGEKFNWTVAPENVSGSTKFEGLTDVTTATVIVASYDSNGALADIDVKKDQAVTDGSITVDGNAGQKVMIWKDLESAKPLTAVQTIEGATTDTGVTITANEDDATKATLKVASTALTGKYILTATSAIDSSKTAKFTVNIEDAKVASAVLSGEENVQYKENGTVTYTVSDIKDQFGNDVTKYFAPTWSSSNEDVLAMDAENPGTFTVKSKGTTTIKAVVDGKEYTMDVTVADYVITKTGITEDSTEVDLAVLAENANTSGYLVTTAKDGVLVEQTTVEKPAEGTTITVNTTGADSLEVSPILTFNDVGNIPDGSGLKVAIPNGSYDFTITKASTTRADVFVNGVMIANNVDQSDDGKGSREIKTGGTYTAEEIVVKGGKAVVTMYDKVSDMQTVVVKKNPSNVNRKTRVYVLGDSLVTNYYGDPTSVNEETGVPNPGNARTGWGQVLKNYLGSDMNLSNLAESGNYAAGLYGNGADSSAFGGVINNAQKGDYLILECGYNDRNYSTTAGMTEAVNAMVDACRAKGITPILVTPNASKHDYKADVMYASTLRDCATAKDVMIVDLSANSYKFFSEKYGTDETANTVVGRNYQVWTNAETVDTLHSSYVGAMKFAEIVAQGIADLQAAGTTTASGENANGITINKEFKFSFVDTLDNTIEMQVKDSSGSEEVSPSPAP